MTPDFDPLADLLATLDLEELGTARITVEGVGSRAVQGVGSRPILGAEKVARFYLGIAAGLTEVQVETVLINGSLGFLARGRRANGQPLYSVLAVAVADGRITGFFNQLNPSKLELRDLE